MRLKPLLAAGAAALALLTGCATTSDGRTVLPSMSFNLGDGFIFQTTPDGGVGVRRGSNGVKTNLNTGRSSLLADRLRLQTPGNVTRDKFVVSIAGGQEFGWTAGANYPNTPQATVSTRSGGFTEGATATFGTVTLNKHFTTAQVNQFNRCAADRAAMESDGCQTLGQLPSMVVFGDGSLEGSVVIPAICRYENKLTPNTDATTGQPGYLLQARCQPNRNAMSLVGGTRAPTR